MKLVHDCYNPETDHFDYNELLMLRKEIDTLLDRAGYEDEELYQKQVRNRIKGIAIDLGVNRDFLTEGK